MHVFPIQHSDLLSFDSFFSGIYTGSLGIAPTGNCTHFLKIGFVVAEGGFNSYYIHQWDKSDKVIIATGEALFPLY